MKAQTTGSMARTNVMNPQDKYHD